MKRLLTRYLKLQNEILYLEYFAIFLLGFLTINLINSLYENGVKNSTSGLEVLGVIVSVLLISKVASRHIVHEDVSYENIRNKGLAQHPFSLLFALEQFNSFLSYW